jgi:hypothetical protein
MALWIFRLRVPEAKLNGRSAGVRVCGVGDRGSVHGVAFNPPCVSDTNPGTPLTGISLSHDTPVRLGLVLVAVIAAGAAFVGHYRVGELEKWRDKQDAMGVALRLQRIEDALTRIEKQMPTAGKRISSEGQR